MNMAIRMGNSLSENGARLLILCAAVCMLIASASAKLLVPTKIMEHKTEKLSEIVPTKFDGWFVAQDGTQQVSLIATDDNGNDPMQEVYNDSLLRTYVGPSGNRIMLAIAYDNVQREEDRVHRPEICYQAQGFRIVYDLPAQFGLLSKNSELVDGRQMLTVNGGRWEAVSFWIRTGGTLTQNPWKSRIYVVREGLAGRLHDGLLLRVSEIIAGPFEAQQSFERQRVFLAKLTASLPPEGAEVIVGQLNNEARAVN
jgi:EpsI family protein